MRTDEIEKLSEELKKHISTFKKVSKDSSNGQSMCESQLTVINFDKLPKEYMKAKGIHTTPKSNDALYIEDGQWHFIEFKNGSIDKYDVFKKIYDSLIMLMDLNIINDIDFVRQCMTYTLVYNPSNTQNVDAVRSALKKNNEYLSKLSKKEIHLYNIGELEGYLFKSTHTYTPLEFNERFIKEREKQLQCQ